MPGVGEVTEGIILAELLKHGETVLLPFGNSERYDLVLDRKGTFLRVQCKTARLRKGCVVCYTQRTHGGHFCRYGSSEVDLFAIYCVELQKVYIVPAEEIASYATIHLRVETSLNNQKKNLRWAEKYEYK